MSRKLLALPLIALAATAADAPSLAALDALQPGRWLLSSADADFRKRSMCMSDPGALIQIRQPSNECSRFVIQNDPTAATVHYTCPGAGHGRTTVRVETPRLAQVETQGMVNGSPFDLAIEARRVGDCPKLAGR